MRVNVTGFFKLTISVCALLIAGCEKQLEGDSFEESLSRGYAELTVVYIPTSGFAYEDENGDLTGVAIDILKEFADFVYHSQGIDIHYHFEADSEFSSFYNKVKNGHKGVFGIGNVTITERRKLELKFSPPYLTNIAVLISHSDTPPLREMNTISEDFKNMTGLTLEGTLHEDRMKNLKETYWEDLKIEFVRGNSELLNRVSNGQNYFGYIDIYNFWIAAEQGASIQQHSVGELASERFGIIMPLDSDWDDLITDFFDHGQGFRTSRIYRAILEKHLGTELTEKLERARLEANQF